MEGHQRNIGNYQDVSACTATPRTPAPSTPGLVSVAIMRMMRFRESSPVPPKFSSTKSVTYAGRLQPTLKGTRYDLSATGSKELSEVFAVIEEFKN